MKSNQIVAIGYNVAKRKKKSNIFIIKNLGLWDIYILSNYTYTGKFLKARGSDRYRKKMISMLKNNKERKDVAELLKREIAFCEECACKNMQQKK